MLKFYLKYIFLFIILLFFNSCAYKQNSYNNISKNASGLLFIKMPENSLTFEHLSPIVYESIHSYFNSIGYKLSDNKNNSFLLDIKIKKLTPVHKFISPDLLLYNQNIELELECLLFNSQDKLLAKKVFYFFALLSKPKDPILNTGFLDYEYKQLMRRSVPKIEQYFRKYFLDKK
ncbi:hypothetical protein K9L05_02345 [Candidatus Babeliales bacterium]|nr:hypothetical protein [Candidatus Babeliales bacterium]MCF7899466.1 hypothetical protein [Candidatus Babeliales bacterium]